ncbi:Chitotriosidase-1 [Morella rubra]|uniref:Chitotriosidase-1 n=1 Tax=Morella rubra TaxID=262757 RepID=A0A6A1VGF2_9ROSI|nr:Chitotriosidase-1 [Morella rubra]
MCGNKYDFHALDLCWLYPSTEDESGDLGTLLSEWRDAINAEANASGYEPLLLTAQVFYSPQRYQYPRHAIVRTLDWINVMAYDFHSPNNSPDQTRAHAAWRSNEEDQPSGETGINAWLETAGNRTKMIVLGLPFFGYAWSLVDENNNQVYAQAKGAPASYSNPTGFMGYNKINHFVATERKFDPDTKTNYCYDATTWISYDDTEAIAKKIRKAKEKELLGYFAWHVGTDDNWILSKTVSYMVPFPERVYTVPIAYIR